MLTLRSPSSVLSSGLRYPWATINRCHEEGEEEEGKLWGVTIVNWAPPCVVPLNVESLSLIIMLSHRLDFVVVGVIIFVFFDFLLLLLKVMNNNTTIPPTMSATTTITRTMTAVPPSSSSSWSFLRNNKEEGSSAALGLKQPVSSVCLLYYPRLIPKRQIYKAH